MQPALNKLLILDLDETLVHATKNRLDVPEDFVFDDYYVYKRPCLDEFLTAVAQHYAIGIWSSAGDVYVTALVSRILPGAITPIIIWGRSKCTLKRNTTYDTYYFEKRLDKLKKQGFALENILIVDDTPEKSNNNYGNAIYIKAFKGDSADVELTHLHVYLTSLKDINNFRVVEKRGWRNK
jgi:RNA polymerase II subunit A small phosphatase-like protein